ncbi:hypothetical protein [Neobacillus ginsengisoli]|uniref:High-affinity nickel permease n=1 Tax=Neobacillus ginsengisoli TaxID=904295 RepID=A0ABT9Y0X4_9BACI|nr:hypothetical protein [Neobacillus ginsengisoli]MDQ0201165.1 high-affinity nickel permease [Neobacillus ginsengisoli]
MGLITFAILAVLIGMRHGMDGDHVAAIADMVGSEQQKRKQVFLGAMQLILFVIGLLISTVCITFCLSWGFLKARLKRQLYLVLGSITGMYSLGLGVSMLVEFWKGSV